MPRRTKNTRKKEPVAPSAVSKEKIVTIAEDAAVDSFLDDFSVQTATIMKQALKQFEKDAKLAMSALPQKTSIPRDILKMELSEFIKRGGSFQAVWESLKDEKQKPPSLTPEPELKEVSEENAISEEATDSSKEKNMFVTPALSTRSQRSRRRIEQTTAKRKPKPLEEVKVQVYSNLTGSPVDEKTLIQLQGDDLLGEIRDKIMEATAKFPQKWRSKLVQSFREMKAQAALKETDVFVTPATRR